MSGKGANKIVAESQETYENSCVVCFVEVTIFSVGSCDHAVCYVCSTRMRVLCGQNECPICRQELSQVIFSREKQSFRQLEVSTRSGLYDKQYRIVFGDLGIQNAFYKLLEHACPRCKCPPFVDFTMLRKHVQRDHELFYCELCTDNLTIFTFERRCYTREELAMHKRKGDADNTSHRGHPLCEYCDIRYLDRDELFRHLRREHFYCHFCDADGCNQFYSDYPSLRQHFRSDHYLCEEGNCLEEQFTAVFRTDIDLRAHKASMHSRTMGKLATKQTRTLEVEFSLVPRNRQPNGAPAYQEAETTSHYRPLMGSTIQQQPQKTINANDEQEFPALGGAGNSAPVPMIRPSVSIKAKSYKTNSLAKTKENFPALGGGNSAMPSTSSLEGPSTGHYSKMVQKPQAPPQAAPPAPPKGTIIHISNRPAKHPDVTKDFPALPSAKALTGNPKSVSAKHRGLVEDNAMIMPNASLASKLMMVTNGAPPPPPAPRKAPEVEAKVPKLNSEDNFPTLGGSSALSTPPTWVAASATKNKTVESRKAKVAPAPDLTKGSESGKKKAKNAGKNGKNNNNNQHSNNNNNIVSEIGALKIGKAGDLLSLAPPPGFDSLPGGGKGKTKSQPPPGFNSVTLNSVARKPNNNLTFTNSTGESYSIIPTRKYIHPLDSKKRNEVLLRHFQDALKSSAAVKEFHAISQMFMKNKYNALPYYEHCVSALGEKFNEIFPELLALLPDITKQQELFLVHVQQERMDKKHSEAIIDVCSICKQVLIRADLFHHLQAHKHENNFPLLTK
ncbi:E3 ubiquitin-protein ligase ZNF598 isoform X2 [Phlebotomus argentipes]|uniref:E3 ubiquitin-protein ligase ZNF598 isoform X2 n=1 Tax=Phlebotomus argentipes TaxID=94469 RepID=UPI0028935317|nr:E3 ubiquitin-protein ligase ZNF598 isoform X2 [Phlebotomus argentipes]